MFDEEDDRGVYVVKRVEWSRISRVGAGLRRGAGRAKRFEFM